MYIPVVGEAGSAVVCFFLEDFFLLGPEMIKKYIP